MTEARIKKSVHLTRKEHDKLSRKFRGFSVIEDAAEYFGVQRDTLKRVVKVGSGNSVNIQKIVSKL